MTAIPSELKTLRNRLTSYLRDHHLRKTPERYAILERASAMTAHFGVDQLYNTLESEGYHVSKATVYNTLELLVEAGILNRHLFATNITRYELERGSHLHLICRRCGKIRELDAPELTAALLNGDYAGFIPEYSSSSIYGICEECASEV